MLLDNCRVEFYGGPMDGDLLFKQPDDLPGDVYQSVLDFKEALKSGGPIEFHHYMLRKIGAAQFKYMYCGVELSED